MPSKTFKKPKRLPSSKGKGESVTWEQCRARAQNTKDEEEERGKRQKAKNDTHKAIQGHLERIGTTQQSQELGDKYRKLAETLEDWTLSNYGKPGEEQKPYLGRAREPNIEEKPMMDRPRLEADSLQVPGGLGIVEKLWHTIEAMIGRIKKARQRRKTGQAVAAKRNLLELVAATKPDIRRAWEAIDKPEDRMAAYMAIIAATNREGERDDTPEKTMERFIRKERST